MLLTFDDGYRDNYEIAYPLLREHGLTATFFIATGFVDDPRATWWDELAWMVRHAHVETMPIDMAWHSHSGGAELARLPLGPDREDTIAALVARYKTLPDSETAAFLEDTARATGAGRCDRAAAADLWMTWDMVRELHAGGMAIGGHTVTHPILARLPAARQEQEIAGCGQRIRQELGREMAWFAYPVGSPDTFTDETRQILQRNEIQLAFSFYGGFARFAQWDPLDVPRVHVGPTHGPALLQAMLGLPPLFARW